MDDRKKIIKCNRKRAAAAIIAAAAILIFTALAVKGDGAKQMQLTAALLLAAGAAVFALLDISYGRILSAVMCIALPIASLCLLENYNYVIGNLTMPILLLNLAFLYLLCWAAIFLTGSVRIGGLIGTLIPMIFGMANYFVVLFRGTPIVPWDLLSLGTAVSVADNYTFTMSWKAAFSAILFVWVILLYSKSSVRLKGWKVRASGGLAFLILIGVYVSGIQKSSVQSFFGMDTVLFTLNVMYRNNGIAGGFLGNLRFLNIEQPDNYSASKVEEIEARVENADYVEETENEAQYPNVIVIMDEAFSDLSVWGDFATSEEVLPFFSQMQEECIGGEVYVSVKGGNTANTEFEFLTGNTMGFLPAGSVPYQQYVNGDMPSLASHLKSLGFDTLAIHPYNRSGWDRDEVYEYFGFDEFLDRTSFSNPLLMRGYISDSSAFEKIREKFDEKEDDERLFVFEVTMQNHGGYSKENPDFTSYVKLPEVENKTTSILAAEKYLTLMNESDRALQDLIRYFEEQDEPVVVLMFGDHQPSDYITNVIQRICGVTGDDSVAFAQQGYRVPFLIWSNTGLEHKYYDGISVNYLSSVLMEAAGIPKTGYQTYLTDLMEAFPVINANTVRTADGVFHTHEEQEISEQLDEYRILQYNLLVDKKNRVETFFE